MIKKDVLIFLHIYLLAVKDVVSKDDIEDFRSEIYRLLIISRDYADFWQSVTEFKLCGNNYKMFRGFTDYMSRIERVIDKHS